MRTIKALCGLLLCLCMLACSNTSNVIDIDHLEGMVRAGQIEDIRVYQQHQYVTVNLTPHAQENNNMPKREVRLALNHGLSFNQQLNHLHQITDRTDVFIIKQQQPLNRRYLLRHYGPPALIGFAAFLIMVAATYFYTKFSNR